MKKLLLLFPIALICSMLFFTEGCTQTQTPAPVHDTVYVNHYDTLACTNKCGTAIACYPFTGNADDSSGHGLNGTVSEATLTTDRFGNANSAYAFNGTSSYIDLPKLNQFGMTWDEMSISFWSQVNATGDGDVFTAYPDVISDRLNGNINYGHTSGNSIFWDHGNITTGRAYASPVPLVTTWEHYVFTCSKTNSSMKVYRNNVLVINKSGTVVSLTDLTRVLRIGAGANGTLYINGKLDDIRIFNREVTSSEVDKLFNNLTI